jgi:uncharacterized protein (TIGR03437 family)
MRVKWTAVLMAGALLPFVAAAATFGTVVPVHGAVADIAIDETRGNLYAANFAAYRVEVIKTATATLSSSITTPAPPSAVAVSPDAHYLVIGLYQTPLSTTLGGFQQNTGGLMIVDLTSGSVVQTIAMNNPVISVAFGSDGNALVIVSLSQQPDPTIPNAFLLTPSTGNVASIGNVPLYSRILPQNPTASEAELLLAVSPPQLIQTGTAVSTDRNTITIVGAQEQDDSASSTKSTFVRYDVPSQTLTVRGEISTPPLGPRAVASDATGANVVMGWELLKWFTTATCLSQAPDPSVGSGFCVSAEYQGAQGAFDAGGHAWDVKRNLIYSQIPVADSGAVLHVVDTDNLNVRERLQIPEGLMGKAFMSTDGNTMYAVSQSGVTIFPIGNLPQTQQVGTQQEDLLYANNGNGCIAGLYTQTLNVVSLSSVQTDFTLSLPQGVSGVTLSQTTGTTPAQVQISIDPLAFQAFKGTTTVPLTITSNGSVNLPPAVRLLVNMAGANQVGRIFNVPGKIVDVLADPVRSRLYLLRQDQNIVKVYDMATLTNIANLRTGNTPTQMVMTLDNNYLVVGNDNSMLANVFDLNAMTATAPIIFPFGHYPRALGFTYTKSFALMRNAGLVEVVKDVTPPATVDQIDFANRVAYTPETLDGGTDPAIFSNHLNTADGIITPSGDGLYLMLSLSDGTVAEYDAYADAWVASRHDLTNLGGSYGAINNQFWNAGSSVFNGAMVPQGTPFPVAEGTPSGFANFNSIGIRASATTATAPGLVTLFNPLSLTDFSNTSIAEAPITQNTLSTTPVGLIGETILPFTRSVALSPDLSTVYVLSTSGLTILPGNFSNPPAAPQISSIVSSADGVSPVATGGLISIWGSNFTNTSSPVSGYPLATSLANACVTANGSPIPLFFASPSLINAQLPYTITGNAAIAVVGPGGVSPSFGLGVQPIQPSIFLNTSASPGNSIPFVLRQANGLLVTPSNPVHRGDTLLIYVNGLGQTTPAATAGNASPSNPLEEANAQVQVSIAGTGANLLDASLAPGVAGVYQVIVGIPTSAPLGLSVPLTVTAGGASQTVSVRLVQ